MNFSQTAGVTVVPTLSRIVLCVVFLSAGWNKIMKTETFTGPQAERLIELGVVGRANAVEPNIEPASWQNQPMKEVDPSTDPPADSDTEPEPEQSEPVDESVEDSIQETVKTAVEEVEKAVEKIPTPPDDVVIDDAAGTGPIVQAKGLYHVVLMVDAAGWPFAKLQGWLAGLTELLGGALLLVGFLSRIWGLGLTITMCVAFYMTSYVAIQANGLFHLPRQDFSTLSLQLSMFVLAFGVLLTGPGPLSLDRLLFGKRAVAAKNSEEE